MKKGQNNNIPRYQHPYQRLINHISDDIYPELKKHGDPEDVGEVIKLLGDFKESLSTIVGKKYGRPSVNAPVKQMAQRFEQGGGDDS